MLGSGLGLVLARPQEEVALTSERAVELALAEEVLGLCP